MAVSSKHEACCSPLQSLSGEPGLFITILSSTGLLGWSLLGATARWGRPAIESVRPALIDAYLCPKRTIFQLVSEADLERVWARLAKDGGSVDQVEPEEDDNLIDRGYHETPLLSSYMSSGAENTLLHVAFNARGPSAHRLRAWMLAQPGAATACGAQNKKGQTVLHIGARRHISTVTMRRVLRLSSSPLEAKDNYEATPLVDAVREEHKELVKMLVEARADPNAFVPNCHGHGDTPLVLAVRLKNLPIVKELLAAPRLDLHQKTLLGVPFGMEALDFAPPSGPIRKILEEAVARSDSEKQQTDAAESGAKDSVEVQVVPGVPESLDLSTDVQHAAARDSLFSTCVAGIGHWASSCC
eukprot:gnl/TRDRNA2_/TRDRNA2_90727_c0_seq1.p1 gnl/TRDRNA2_/TRDRNA2_90727_c0~~gnl/TRDRNA2_/TRDRNA2_90727_c0_seq1.p1  ORF type:complete len:357 (-),score=56.55 gnl/TRDRNA2_/TRDRNA2_90727_c0_seq1:73-1143(-)